MNIKYILHNDSTKRKRELDCDTAEVKEGTIILKEKRGCGYRVKGYMRLTEQDYLEVVYE